REKYPFGLGKIFHFNEDIAVADFNLKHGQAKDAWSAGLLILSILVGREEAVTQQKMGQYETFFIAPLPCLKKRLSGERVRIGYQEEGIENLTQKAIDKDIDQLQIEVLQKHPEERASVETLFRTVKQMLKVNPDERLNINQLLAPLQQELDCWKVEYSSAS
ncbi:MAG TPA: hypothetical protein VGM34_01650, partial [Chlamydiales bacterium]